MKKENDKKDIPDSDEVYDPENTKMWCDRCEKHTMVEHGSVYLCPICENWFYSSS